MALNVQMLQGQWNQLKGEVKKRWGQLTDDDLRWSGGNIDQLVGRIEQKTGETQEAIKKYLDQLSSQGGSAVSHAVETVGSYANDVSHRLRDHYGQISEQAHEGYASAREVVVRNPMQWVAVAFGVGVLAGIFMGGTFAAASSSSRHRFI
jgi:uncharacterized protein YjbJ (UPF0337 family)